MIDEHLRVLLIRKTGKKIPWLDPGEETLFSLLNSTGMFCVMEVEEIYEVFRGLHPPLGYPIRPSDITSGLDHLTSTNRTKSKS